MLMDIPYMRDFMDLHTSYVGIYKLLYLIYVMAIPYIDICITLLNFFGFKSFLITKL